MRNTDMKIEEVYEFIKKRREQTGYAPSVRDIRDAVGIKSTSTVHSYIARLIEEGRLIKDDGKSRSLRAFGERKSTGDVLKVPLLGKVAAGVPITAVLLHLLKDGVHRLLDRRGLPLATAEYRHVREVDEETGEIYRTEPQKQPEAPEQQDNQS